MLRTLNLPLMHYDAEDRSQYFVGSDRRYTGQHLSRKVYL